MLVLNRKIDQAVMIGSDIEVLVTEVKGDSVKLGIRAPRDVPVHRREVYDLIQDQNRAAAAPLPEDLDRFVDYWSRRGQTGSST
jgi:carbon storage regulator